MEKLSKIILGMVAVAITIKIIAFTIKPTAMEAVGTGFIVDKQGIIVTANHMTAGFNTIYVYFKGIKYEAKLIARDKSNDIALLKILPVDSDTYALRYDIRAGEPVYAIGYPNPDILGYKLKISKGKVIVPYFSQYILSNIWTIGGNSGGPVVDKYGNAVGVMVANLNSQSGSTTSFIAPAIFIKQLIDKVNYVWSYDIGKKIYLSMNIVFSSAISIQRAQTSIFYTEGQLGAQALTKTVLIVSGN